jgi:pimeloyl-ACP methyl ester carboxylesterase
MMSGFSRTVSAAVLAFALAGNLWVDAYGQSTHITPAQALISESKNALPITSFYNTPANLSKSKPGTLLRKEVFTGYDLPPGVTAVRILYHSASAAGRDVAASAAVLIPAGDPPPGGWPIIAWAHGTSGVARQCAPSAMKNVYYGHEGLFDMVKAGFAVVAVDYHGLGTVGPHEYNDKVANANDVINAVPAARAAVPSLGVKWVVDGHSQGGQAAWGVAEQEAVRRDSGYLGAVAVAAATLHGWMVSHPDSTKGAGFYFAWIAYAVHARFPSFQPSEILTKVGTSHYADVTAKGCWFYGSASYDGVDAPRMIKPSWGQNSWMKKWLAENTVAKAPLGGPIFVIAGEADQSVPIAAVREVVQRACRNRLPLYFRSYPGLDHEPAMVQSTPDQIAWMRDRFAGKPAPSNCASNS